MLKDEPQAVTERVAKRVASLYGIPVVDERHARTAAQAIEDAQQLGFPVVLKLDSPDATHKTELGAVMVGLPDAESVGKACDEMLRRAKGLRCEGFLVQPMVRGHVELMLGMKRDPVFGPLIIVAVGGVLVELLRDVTSELAPISPDGALTMLKRLGTYPLLEGYRNKAGVNLPALAQVIADFSQMCAELGDAIEEIDINPLICGAGAVTAVDALIVKSGPSAN